MSESVIVAIITGGLALLGTWLTVKASNNKIISEMDKHNAVQDTKIEELTREVRMHNEFAVKVPVIQEQVRQLKEAFAQIKTAKEK